MPCRPLYASIMKCADVHKIPIDFWDQSSCVQSFITFGRKVMRSLILELSKMEPWYDQEEIK